MLFYLIKGPCEMAGQARANSKCAEYCVNLNNSKYSGGACNSANRTCECTEDPCRNGDTEQADDNCFDVCDKKRFYTGFCVNRQCKCRSE